MTSSSENTGSGRELPASRNGAINMTFAAGEMVRLKSGGPLMTVELVADSAVPGAISCIWFEKVGTRQVVQRDTFPPAVLERAGKLGFASHSARP